MISVKPMRSYYITSLATVLAGILSIGLASADTVSRLEQMSLPKLEARLVAIDSELDQLAHYSPRHGAGAIGYRSDDHSDPDHTEWIQIELESPTPIDQIVLVPTIARDMKVGFVADGFPLRFRILAGTAEHPDGTELASFNRNDLLLPRIAPLIIPCATNANWVRVEVSKLSQRTYDGKYNLELAEIMLFKDSENIALNRPITVSSDRTGGSRNKKYLVDGSVPYLMNSGIGTSQKAYLATAAPNDRPSLRIDLEQSVAVNRIHLHAVDVSDTAPQSVPSGYALPKLLRLEGANQADFSDATLLVEYPIQSIYDAGPIITCRFPETVCRYIRITGVDPFLLGAEHHFGFAEIEVFSKGQNAALHKPVTGLETLSYRPLSAVTDGRNIFGQILPLRQWMEQLARRHDLETERPLILAELNARYNQQKKNLRRMTWIAALLVVGIGASISIGRRIRKKHETQLKNRFAADLHDEIGANIHTLGLLSALLKKKIIGPTDGESDLLQRIQTLITQSSTAVSNVSELQAAKEFHSNAAVDLQRAATQILIGLEHEFTVEGGEFLSKLKPQTQTNLVLFYKECLINICRHAEASTVKTQLIASPQEIQLIITDDGRGVPDSVAGGVPPSLKRRAKILNAELAVKNSTPKGTVFVLRHRRSPWRRIQRRLKTRKTHI